jgi:molecular chaperone DnaK
MAVYGIDFGTCNSCIAVAEDNGSLSVVPSFRNETTIPSVVMFRDDGMPIVGTTARNAFGLPNPRNVVAFAKTEMENEYTKDEYQISETETRKLSPIEPVACILYELISHSNHFRVAQSLPVSNSAVITVPAVCSDIQRQKTKIAAELAGINVLKVVSEPTAAAISYNIRDGETVMVFDLGGGTLDVSIVQCADNRDYKVLATAGDSELGGRCWDKMLLQLCYENSGLVFSDSMATTKRLIEIEPFKIDLPVAHILNIPFVDDTGIPHSVKIKIEEFEQSSQHLIDRALRVVDRALEGVSDVKIDRVCLAGGASKMPAIKRNLQQHLPGVVVEYNNPDTAIAIGAAKYAKFLSDDNGSENISIDEHGHAYGIVTRTKDNVDVVENIIMKNDALEISGRTFVRYMPTSSKHLFITIIENDIGQRFFDYDGQRAFFSGDVHFPEKVKLGKEIDFILSRDSDGIVHLNVACSGEENQFEFATKVNEVSDEIRHNVLELISKMRNN